MASPTFTYLALDDTYDPIFANNTTLYGVEAVAQAIGTRLRLFLGEWWENLNVGLPLFQQMLGQLASGGNLAAMQASVQRVVEGTPYVLTAKVLSTAFDGANLSVQVYATTVFGSVTINNALGLNAAI